MDELSTRNSTQDVPLGETLISPALDEGAAQGVVVVAKSRRPAKPQSSKKKRSARGAKSSRRKTASRSHGAAPANSESAAGKARRSFPASTFGEALVIAQGVQQYASGQKIRRLTLFDNLQKSPDSGPSRQLITNSSKYGLTKGNYTSEWIELTPDGAIATSSDAPADQRLLARFKLAIAQIPPFFSLYQQYKGVKLPAQSVMRDHLVEQGYAGSEVNECVDTFILNAKELGVLRTLAGAERVVPIEQVVEEIPRNQLSAAGAVAAAGGDGAVVTTGAADWSKIVSM